LHSVFSEDAKVNFLLLTPEVQYRQQINEKEIHLPESDLSVILNTFNGIQKAAAGEENISLLFDNISDVIARCGFDETYEFTRALLEVISSSNTTAVFAFTPSAHDQEVSSSIRELFQAHLAYSSSGARIMSL
jgi:AraC-like DNA-binding protein